MTSSASLCKRHIYNAVCFCLALILAGCGGGGGAGGDQPPAQYTIGGNASGVARPVVLHGSQGSDLTVTANGAFVLSGTVSAGGSYSVTVPTPPLGQVCTVTNGSGTANGNVTNISVVCSADPGAYFIPFKATGQILGPGGAYIGPWPPPTNGTNGLMVVASDAITAAPTFVTKEYTTTLGLSQQLNVDPTGVITAGAPSALIYATQGVSGGDHLWAVDLSGGSTLVPRQLSNLSGNFISVLSCGYFQAFKNLSDPSSAFFILAHPTDQTNLCGGAPSTIQNMMIRLSDSADTVPTPVPVGADNLLALYDPSGALAGFVRLDAFSQQLLLYADETFTNPRVLLSNVSNFSPIQAPNVSPLVKVSSAPGVAIIMVTTTTDFSEKLYRVDYTGAISTVYAFQGQWNGLTQDSKSFFLEDLVSSTTNPSVRVLQIPMDGSTVQILDTEAPFSSLPYLEGSNGSQLVLLREPQYQSDGTVTAPGLIQTLAVGAPGTPQTIASISASFSAELGGNNVYVTTSVNGPDTSYGPQESTEIIALDGTVLQPLTAESFFPYFFDPGLILQVRGIADPGGVGGGDFFVLDPSAPTAPSPAQVMLPDGSPYTFPTKSNFPYLQPLTTGIATGSAGYSTQSVGYVYDTSRHVIVTVSLPSTDVGPVRAPF